MPFKIENLPDRDLNKKLIVISAISIRDGGALTILKLVFEELNLSQYIAYDIIFLVQNKQLLPLDLPSNIQVIEIHKGKVSWLKRLYFEYVYFYKLSKKLNPDSWISLHEITPFIKAKQQIVYCHHPHLFLSHPWKMLSFEPTIWIFKTVFNILNWFTIRKNDYVIVQQNWMRKGMKRNYGFSLEKIIVARPNFDIPILPTKALKTKLNSGKRTFIYPVMPRSFKNFEIIGETVKTLHQQGIHNYEILLTVDGTENKYAKWLKQEYGHLPTIKFMGKQTHETIMEWYKTADYLIFPSFIESWGLPITEFKLYNKPIILADLPYARETLGNYDKALFFDPNDAIQLTQILTKVIGQQEIDFQVNRLEQIEQPYVENWTELFNIILK